MFFGLAPMPSVMAENGDEQEEKQEQFIKMPVIAEPKEGDTFITGFAEPGSTVKLWLDSVEPINEPAATATAGDNGSFTLSLSRELNDNETLSLRAEVLELRSRVNKSIVIPKTAVIGERKKVYVLRDSTVKNGGYFEREPESIEIGQIPESDLVFEDGKVRYFELIWNTSSPASPSWSMRGSRAFYDLGNNVDKIKVVASRGFSAILPRGSGWKGVSRKHKEQNEGISEPLKSLDQMDSVISTPLLQDEGPQDPLTLDREGGWVTPTGADGKVGYVRFYLDKEQVDDQALQDLVANGLRLRSWLRQSDGKLITEMDRTVFLYSEQSNLGDTAFSASKKYVPEGNLTYHQTPALGGVDYDPQAKTLSTTYELTKQGGPIPFTTDLYIKIDADIAALITDTDTGIKVDGKTFNHRVETGVDGATYLIVPDVHNTNGEQNQEMIGKAVGPYSGNFVFQLDSDLGGVLNERVNTFDLEFELRDRSLTESIDHALADFKNDSKMSEVDAAIRKVWNHVKSKKTTALDPATLYGELDSPGQPSSTDYYQWLTYTAHYPEPATIDYTRGLIDKISGPLVKGRALERLNAIQKIGAYLPVVDEQQRINNTRASNYILATDYDRDGLLDQAESNNGTNTNIAMTDTDADGLSDSQELINDQDPIIHPYEWYDSHNVKVEELSDKSTSLSGNVGNYSHKFMQLGYMFPRTVELWKVSENELGEISYLGSEPVASTTSNKDLEGSFLLQFAEGTLEPGDKLVVKYITTEVVGKIEEDDEESVLQKGYGTPEVSEIYQVPEKTPLEVDNAAAFGETYTYITGTTDPNAEVKIVFSDKSILTVNADAEGNFKGLISNALPQAPTLEAGQILRATAKAEGKSPSDEVEINVVSSTPKPTINEVKEGDAIVTGSIYDATPKETVITIRREGQEDVVVPSEAVTYEEDGSFTITVSEITDLDGLQAGDVIIVDAQKDELPRAATETTVISKNFEIDKLESIKILNKPQDTYLEGDTMNLTGLQVKLTDSDGDFNIIDVTDPKGTELTALGFEIALQDREPKNTLEDAGLTVVGPDQVTIWKNVGETKVEGVYDITVQAKVFNKDAIVEFEVIQNPKLNYEENDPFIAQNLKVKLTDNAGLTKEVDYKDFADYGLELFLEESESSSTIFTQGTPLHRDEHDGKKLFVQLKNTDLKAYLKETETEEGLVPSLLKVNKQDSLAFEMPEIDPLEKTVGEELTRQEVLDHLKAQLDAAEGLDPQPTEYTLREDLQPTDSLTLHMAGEIFSPVRLVFNDGSKLDVTVPVNISPRKLSIEADTIINPDNQVTEENKKILVKRTEEKNYPLTDDASYTLIIDEKIRVTLTREQDDSWSSDVEGISAAAEDGHLAITFEDGKMDLIRGEKPLTVQRFDRYGSFSNVLNLRGPGEMQSKPPKELTLEDPASGEGATNLKVVAGDPSGFKPGDTLYIQVGENEPFAYIVTEDNLNEDKTVTIPLDQDETPQPLQEGTTVKVSVQEKKETDDELRPVSDATEIIQEKEKSTTPEAKFGDDTAEGNTTVTVKPGENKTFADGDEITVTGPDADDKKVVKIGDPGVTVNDDGTVTVDLGKKLTDEQQVKVTVTENGKAPSDAVTLTQKTTTDPTIDPVTEGDETIGVTPDENADKITITIPGEPATVIELTKDDDGNWTDGTNIYEPANGKIDVPLPDGVKAGDKITVETEDEQGNKASSETTVKERPKTPKPQLAIETSRKDSSESESPGNTVLTVTPGGETPKPYAPGDTVTVTVPQIGKVTLTYTESGWTITENTTGKDMFVVSGDTNSVKLNMGNEIPGTTQLLVNTTQGQDNPSENSMIQVPTDKSGLTEAINETGDKLPGEHGEGTPEKKLNDAIDKAEEVLQKDDATQKEIDEATEALKKAKEEYDNYKTPQPTATTKSTPATDTDGTNGKTELTVVPGEGHTFKAGDKINVVIPGPTPETRTFEVTSESINPDGSVTVDLGNKIPGDSELTVTVEEKKADSDEYKAPSDPIKVPVLTDKSELKKQIDSAGGKIDGDYPEDSVEQNFNAAYDKAQEVNNDPTATQEEIDKATKDLEKAKRALTEDMARLFVNEISAADGTDPEKLRNAVNTDQIPGGTFVRKETTGQANQVKVTLQHGGETLEWLIEVPTTLPEEGDHAALRAQGLIIDLNDPAEDLSGLTEEELRKHIFLGNSETPASDAEVTMTGDLANLVAQINALKTCPNPYDPNHDTSARSLSLRFDLADGVERSGETSEQSQLLQIVQERMHFETFYQMFEEEVWFAVQDYKAYLARNDNDRGATGPLGGPAPVDETEEDNKATTDLDTGESTEEQPADTSKTVETEETNEGESAAETTDGHEDEANEPVANPEAPETVDPEEPVADEAEKNSNGGGNDNPFEPMPDLFGTLVANLRTFEDLGQIDPLSLAIRHDAAQPTRFSVFFTSEGREVNFSVDVASEVNLAAAEPGAVEFELWAMQLTLIQEELTAESELTSVMALVLAGDAMEAQFFADYGVDFKDMLQLDREGTTAGISLDGSREGGTESAHIKLPILVIPAKCPATNTLYEPQGPAELIGVVDPNQLQPAEIETIKDEVRKNNTDLPEGTNIDVALNGDVTVIYPDGTKDMIDRSKVVTPLPPLNSIPDGSKVPVKDPNNLTVEEKAKVEEEVRNANPGLPEGTTIDIGPNGEVTVTYPAGGTANLSDNVKQKTPQNEVYDPKVPDSKVLVKDKNNLTDEEKEEVKKAIEEKNPDLPEDTTIVIGDDGSATIIYPDQTVDTIDGDQLVEEESKPQSDADKYDPKAPDNKVPVENTNNLTAEEKDEVKKAIEEKNPELPENTTIVIGNDGSATITYPDGSQDAIDGKDLVVDKNKPQSDADKYDPKAPDRKVPVEDTNNLTDEEKEKVKEELRKKNPDLPENTDITIGDDGTATITYPDGSQDTIDGDKLVRERTDAERLDPNPLVTPIPVRNKEKLTQDEKDRVVTGIRNANPDLPSGTYIDIADDGTATLRYPDGSYDVIPGDRNVVQIEYTGIYIPRVKIEDRRGVDTATKRTIPSEKQVDAATAPGAPTVVTSIPATGEDIAVPLTMGFVLLALASVLLLLRKKH